MRVAPDGMHFLKLKMDLDCPCVASTGSLEGSHKYWDSILIDCHQNKVPTVL